MRNARKQKKLCATQKGPHHKAFTVVAIPTRKTGTRAAGAGEGVEKVGDGQMGRVDDDMCPCDTCTCECDTWDAQACCELCKWRAGTDDDEILDCENCRAREDL